MAALVVSAAIACGGEAAPEPAAPALPTLPTRKPCPQGVVCGCAGYQYAYWQVHIDNQGRVSGTIGTSSQPSERRTLELTWRADFRIAQEGSRYVLADSAGNVLARDGDLFLQPGFCALLGGEVETIGTPAPKTPVPLPAPPPCPAGAPCACSDAGVREMRIGFTPEGRVLATIPPGNDRAFELVWDAAFRLAFDPQGWAVVDSQGKVLARHGSRFANPKLCGVLDADSPLEVRDLGTPLP